MRTVIATGDYFRGGETFVNYHIEHLFGGAVGIVTGRHSGENPLGKPIFVRRKKGHSPLRTPVATLRNLARYNTTRIATGAAEAELLAFLRDTRAEVLLSEFGTQALAFTPICAKLNIPLFTYFRGSDASKELQRPRIIKAYRKMFPHLAGVFSVSQFLLDALGAEGIRHDNAHVIPSGVDLDRFQPGEKIPESCLAVGRMVAKKAPLATLDAFAKVAAGRPRARLTMIGDGPLMEPLRARVAELGLTSRVDLPGSLPHDAVRDHLARTSVFLQHSITAADGNTEGMPTAIQEALAAGCAILSTRHAGIPEAVDEGITGHLVAEHDFDAYAARLGDLLSAPDLAEMGAAARAVAETRFDKIALTRRIEQIIRATSAP